MPQPTPFTIGIVGHRYIDPEPIEAFVIRSFLNILSSAKKHHSNLIALSALAIGADTHFAQTALTLHIPLHVILPFQEYSQDFTTEKSLTAYQELRAVAACEEILPFAQRSQDAYYAAMQEVVSKSDLLLAVWDGQGAKGKGGTADAVVQARSTGKDWIHLDIRNATIHDYCKKYSYA